MLAEAPRQIINGYNLYSKLISVNNNHVSFKRDMFYGTFVQSTTLVLIIISFTLFFISVIAIIVALFLYIPLVCQIQGNLKEYVCHKIDKRIGRIIKSKARRRMVESQRREQQRSHIVNSLRNSKPNSTTSKMIPSPTLPSIAIGDEELREFSQLNARTPPESLLYTGSSISSKNSRQTQRKLHFKLEDRSFYENPEIVTNTMTSKEISQNSPSVSLISSRSTGTSSVVIKKTSLPNFPVSNFAQPFDTFHPSTIQRKPLAPSTNSQTQHISYYRLRPPVVSNVVPRTPSPSSISTTSPLISATPSSPNFPVACSNSSKDSTPSIHF